MKLEEFKKDADFFSSKASEMTRNLAFAGIAVIWIFKNPLANTPTLATQLLPVDLILPLGLFCLSLISDLLQYLAGFIATDSFHRSQEKKGKKPSDEVTANPLINIPTYLFF